MDEAGETAETGELPEGGRKRSFPQHRLCYASHAIRGLMCSCFVAFAVARLRKRDLRLIPEMVYISVQMVRTILRTWDGPSVHASE